MNSPLTRIEAAREYIKKKNIDCLLVLSEENRRYLSGFTAEDHQFDETAGALLITEDRLMLITDSRFELQAENEAHQYELYIYKQAMAAEIGSLVKRFGIDRLGLESDRVSIKFYHDLEAGISANGCPTQLISLLDLAEILRQVKDEGEINHTRKALSLSEDVFRKVVTDLHTGMTEKQLAWQIEKGLREAGADSLSFPVIVASGPNSALPHAVPSDRRIQAGEPLLIDWGCKLDGYCSDTTRTIVIGSPDDVFLQVYNCVLEAQQRAVSLIKAGVNSKSVDAAARDFIYDQGFKGKFGHGLGHGTGLAVHEAPRLSPIRESELVAGMIVTVEPGIYLPGWGGVRIEHQVVIRSHGAEILNELSATYDPNKY